MAPCETEVFDAVVDGLVRRAFHTARRQEPHPTGWQRLAVRLTPVPRRPAGWKPDWLSRDYSDLLVTGRVLVSRWMRR